MQDPSAAAFQAAIKAAPKFPQEEQHLRCPRCDSTNTKFCYYNNYNLSQPRHFCKDCRRYWTRGGALRNIPVGGGTRKNSKRGASSSASSSPSSSSAASHAKRSNNPPSSSAPAAVAVVPPTIVPSSHEFLHSEGRKLADADHEMLDFTGSFSSLLTSTGHFGSLLDSFHAGVPAVLGAGDHPGHQITSSGNVSEISGGAPPHPAAQPEQPPLPDNLLGDSGCWSGSSGGGGWPDLSIYTPGSSFQ